MFGSVCAASMMLERSGGVAVAGGVLVAPPPSCACPHNARLSMMRCLSSSFLPLQSVDKSRPFSCSALFMSGTFALFLSPVPYSVYWMHEDTLLVSGRGGLGPLMALAAMRLRHLDFRRHHLDIPRSGPCISTFGLIRPDFFKPLPILPSYSRFVYVSMMWHQSHQNPAPRIENRENIGKSARKIGKHISEYSRVYPYD